MTSIVPPQTRRSFLALSGAALTSGCARRFQSAVSRDERSRLSLTIKTVPADADVTATRLARYLATRLQRVGIDASVVPMSREELRRSVLLNHDFDLYVSRFDRGLDPDPDFLRPLLHSRFSAAPGWQNPFGYGALDLDEALVEQTRQHGTTREETVASIQEQVLQDQPFTVVGVPDAIRTTRQDRVVWEHDPLHSVAGYLTARPRTEAFEPRATATASERLRMATTDARPSKNLNPLSTPFRRTGVFVDLVYDSLGRRVGGTIRPWLARSWSWSSEEPLTATVRLREGLQWHDGRELTAEDVAFTYRFLSDTTMGEADEPVPAPRYRGQASLVEDIEVVADDQLTMSFDDRARSVATRALTVPVLPRHVWTSYTEPATIAGLDIGTTTEALVHNNLDPVGSGPLRVADTTPRESIRLEPFDDHFLGTTDVPHLDRFGDGFSFDGLTFSVVPSDGAAVGLVKQGKVDATATPIARDAIPRVAEVEGLALLLEASPWCYHVGYNHRRPPFTNPRFRRAVARLLDREYVTNSLFAGYATPAVSPLADTDYAVSAATWNGSAPALPFVGDGGTLDLERARELFRDAGYTYTRDGALLVQG